jgi:hypothetical protein
LAILLRNFARRAEENCGEVNRDQASRWNALPSLGALARGQDFRLFLLWLFDFFFLTVVAFTHNKFLVWLVAMRVAMRGEKATAKRGFAQRTAEATEEAGRGGG